MTADSDSSVLRDRIDFSAALLRRHIERLIDDYSCSLSRIQIFRSEAVKSVHLQEIALEAENAFRSSLRLSSRGTCAEHVIRASNCRALADITRNSPATR